MKKGYDFLLQILEQKGITQVQLAERLGITPQAIQTWKSRIPGKRVSQLSEHLSLESHEIDILLGNDPLCFEFRTKRGEHIGEVEVTESTKIRSQVLYERLFPSREAEVKYDLTPLQEKISKCGRDFLQIADCVRKEFTVPDYRPLLADELFGLYARVGAKAYFMPFKQIGLLNGGGSQDQTAILFSKHGCHTVLLDSDRTVDEAHFDRTHEFIHIIFGKIFDADGELEDLIDRVCGELIYPKKFIVEQFFSNDVNSKPATNKVRLREVFYQATFGMRHILSPRGLARAMRDSELTTRNSELYKFLYSEFHEEVRKKAVTYSSYGGMDFDFSDRERMERFYSEIVEKSENAGFYPLFQKIKNDLIEDLISPSDFGEMFKMKLSDAMVLKAIWSKKPSQ